MLFKTVFSVTVAMAAGLELPIRLEFYEGHHHEPSPCKGKKLPRTVTVRGIQGIQ
jgi:hypothetical protein